MRDGQQEGRAPFNVLKRDGITLIILLGLTLVMTNPLALHLASAVEDKQDALLNTWIMSWVGHGLITDPVHLFDANIFYPYSNTLAFSETLLPQALLALPVSLAFDNPVLGYNLVLLFSFFLAGYAMYLFVLDLTHNRLAGLIAGLIFAFNPYNLGNLAQVQLLSFGWLPLCLLFLRRMVGERQNAKLESQDSFAKGQKPESAIPVFGFRDPFLFALFFAIQSLASIYFAFLSGIAVVAYFVWTLPGRWMRQAARPNVAQPPLGHVLGRLAFSLLVILILIVPVLWPYVQVQRDLGFERTLRENETFSASLKLYTEVSPANALYGGLLAPRPPIMAGGYPLDNLFPGIVAVVLAIAGLVGAKNREKWFLLFLLALAFVLSLGPRLYITPGLGTDIWLPYRWLYEALPIAHALRAPVRFDALVMFALAVLAALGVQRIAGSGQTADRKSSHRPRGTAGRDPKRESKPAGERGSGGADERGGSDETEMRGHWFRGIVPFVLPVLVILEYLAVPAANITPVPTGADIPAYARWLAQQPPEVVLELPMLAPKPGELADLTFQYLTTFHWQRTPDGYSGFNPPKRGEIAYEMQFFPSERSISLLQALDVRQVVVHSSQYGDWDTRLQAIEGTPDLRLTKQFGADFVYAVAPRGQEIGALSANIYLPKPAAPSQSYFVYLILRNNGPRSFAIQPTEDLRTEARWIAQGGTVASQGASDHAQTVESSIPLVTSSVSVVAVRLVAPPTPGTYRLELDTFVSGIGQWELAGNVSVENGEPAHEVVVPAQVTLSTPLKPEYRPGDTVRFNLAWIPLNKIDAYYSVSVRIVDAHGNKVASQDREPAGRTLLWTPGVSLPDSFELALPQDLAPGDYSLSLLMYHTDPWMDALLLDGQYTPQHDIPLGRISVR